MTSISACSLKLTENDELLESSESWRMCPSPDSPRKPVKSTAVVKYSTVQSLANFACLQCNTDLNLPPSNWLSSSAESYGLQAVPSHSSGFSSFRMAHMFPDCVGEVDVVSDAENIKKLLKIPYSKTPVSMMVHRVENTLLIDEFDIHKHLMRTAETEWEWLKTFFFDNILKSLSDKDKGMFPKNNSRCALQQKSLVSKFLYHSLAVGEPQKLKQDPGDSSSEHVDLPKPMPLEGPHLPEPSLEQKVPDPTSNHKFARNVVWTFENIQMLIGTDLPIFGGTTHPCISLKLRDMSKPINVLTGIDYWLDNLMCNVPELVMCYHLNGIVQKYELIKTEDLPHLEDSKFSPKVIRDVAQNILSFLKSNATKAGHTYWLFKGKDDDAVKLYDLTSLCTADVMDEKGQNPFTVPVAMLLYRVARNMKHSTESRHQQGTIRMLLKNCVALLVKEKYPQIVTSAHYMLSDVYIPANTDPASPGLCSDFDEEESNLNASFCDDDENGDECTSSSVAVKSLCLSMSESEGAGPGEDERKFSTPLPLNLTLEERCSMSLQHVATGLHCLQFFDVEDDRQQKADEERKMQEDQKKSKDAENPNVARPFEAIPMPYTSLNASAESKSIPSTSKSQLCDEDKKATKKKKKDARREREPKSSDVSDDSQTSDSPRALLCKSKVETMPTWNLHLKVLLYEKACLVYATLAETAYLAECYGSSLRYIALVLRCHRVFENLVSCAPNVGLHSYLLGRAGDCCFMIVQNWLRIDAITQDYNCFTDVDVSIIEEVKKEMSLADNDPQIDLIPRSIETLEQMLVASCECYVKALALEPHEKQKSNLRRRLGNIHNELGVLYMNQATQRFQDEMNGGKSASLFQVLFTKSLHHLEAGIRSFEAEKDDVNLALLHSNTGRLMRLCAHNHSPNARAELVGQERHFYNKAFTSYQKALQVLGGRSSNPPVWDTVTWELSTTLFNMATLLQDYPTIGLKSTEEMEREVVEFLQKALKYCDMETTGTRQPVYQFRAATLHHRLASFYHKSFRFLSAEDTKRKNILHLTRLHYDKASHLFMALERPSEFLRAQLEHVAIFEFQAQNAQTLNNKLKHYQSALELIFQCQSMLKIMLDKTRAVGMQTDGTATKSLKSPPKLVMMKQKSARESCLVETKKEQSEGQTNHSQSDEKGLGESNVHEEDLAEQREEFKLSKLLEQRLQFILLKLTHLHTSGTKQGQTKKELDVLGQLYKNFYSMSLKKYTDDSVYELSSHLLSVLHEIAIALNYKDERSTNVKLR